MPGIITDAEISALLSERKPVSADFLGRIVPKPKKGHKGCELSIEGEQGNRFVVMVRQSSINPLDFSVILAFEPRDSNQRFLLKRYNGKGHEHSNVLEKTPTFYDFHIHTATERYQKAGLKEEGFAEVTNRFADWRVALDCLIADCNIALPPDRGSLFSTI